MIEYEIEDEFEDGLPILEARYDSGFDSEDEDSVDESHLLWKHIFKKTRSTSKSSIARASVKYSLEDKDGNKVTYLGFLDTGSTGSLMSDK